MQFFQTTLAAAIAVVPGFILSAEAATLPSTRQPVREIVPLLTTAGDPEDYIVDPGEGFDGVAFLDIGTQQGNLFCSGSLLPTGKHILTAAHCLTDDFGTPIVDFASATFELTTGTVGLDVADFFIFPDWGGFADFESFGGDLAILLLESEAPETAERYNIYRDKNEIGQVGTKVGYGFTGTGNEGEVFFDEEKRAGQNIYDAPGELFSLLPEAGGIQTGAFLGYDFDNGRPENDAFGVIFDIPDLGLGAREVNSAPGDSGGPTFINGLIAGVTSFGFCAGAFECDVPPDVDTIVNSSFGEFSGDTRVSTYASWIDSILSMSPTEVPEPASVTASLLAGLGLLFFRRKTQQL